jgi:hypothetical protein
VGTAGYDVAISGEVGRGVGCLKAGIRILDLSIPDFPTILSSVDTVGNVTGIAVDRITERFCPAELAMASRSLDIADPSAPSVDGQLALPGEATDVEGRGQFRVRRMWICRNEGGGHFDVRCASGWLENLRLRGSST